MQDRISTAVKVAEKRGANVCANWSSVHRITRLVLELERAAQAARGMLAEPFLPYAGTEEQSGRNQKVGGWGALAQQQHLWLQFTNKVLGCIHDQGHCVARLFAGNCGMLLAQRLLKAHSFLIGGHVHLPADPTDADVERAASSLGARHGQHLHNAYTAGVRAQQLLQESGLAISDNDGVRKLIDQECECVFQDFRDTSKGTGKSGTYNRTTWPQEVDGHKMAEYVIGMLFKVVKDRALELAGLIMADVYPRSEDMPKCASLI